MLHGQLLAQALYLVHHQDDSEGRIYADAIRLDHCFAHHLDRTYRPCDADGVQRVENRHVARRWQQRCAQNTSRQELRHHIGRHLDIREARSIGERRDERQLGHRSIKGQRTTAQNRINRVSKAGLTCECKCECTKQSRCIRTYPRRASGNQHRIVILVAVHRRVQSPAHLQTVLGGAAGQLSVEQSSPGDRSRHKLNECVSCIETTKTLAAPCVVFAGAACPESDASVLQVALRALQVMLKGVLSISSAYAQGGGGGGGGLARGRQRQ